MKTYKNSHSDLLLGNAAVSLQLPGYVQNSESVLLQLDKLVKLPNTALICTCDAVSIYSNISTSEGIKAITNSLFTFKKDINTVYGVEATFDSDLIVDLLTLVMNYNVFKFGGTCWKQLTGAAIGTPCACVYTTLFFGYFEHTILCYQWNLT